MSDTRSKASVREFPTETLPLFYEFPPEKMKLMKRRCNVFPATTPDATVGPIIGLVTPTTARILIEVAKEYLVECQLVATTDGHAVKCVEKCHGGKPAIFVFTGLHPGTAYDIDCNVNLPGVVSARVHTPSEFSCGVTDKLIKAAYVYSGGIMPSGEGSVTMRDPHSVAWAAIHRANDLDYIFHLGKQIDIFAGNTEASVVDAAVVELVGPLLGRLPAQLVLHQAITSMHSSYESSINTITVSSTPSMSPIQQEDMSDSSLESPILMSPSSEELESPRLSLYEPLSSLKTDKTSPKKNQAYFARFLPFLDYKSPARAQKLPPFRRADSRPLCYRPFADPFLVAAGVIRQLPNCIVGNPVAADRIRDLFRNFYRKAWSHSFTRHVLASVPSIMFEGNDLFDDVVNRISELKLKTKQAEFLFTCFREVYIEYQVKLHSDRMESHRQDIQTHLFNNVGILCLDTFNPDTADEKASLSNEQLRICHSALMPGGLFQDAQILLITIPKAFLCRDRSNAEHLRSLIDMVHGWKHRCPEQSRQIHIITTCDTGVTSATYEVDLNADGRVLCVAPLSQVRRRFPFLPVNSFVQSDGIRICCDRTASGSSFVLFSIAVSPFRSLYPSRANYNEKMTSNTDDSNMQLNDPLAAEVLFLIVTPEMQKMGLRAVTQNMWIHHRGCSSEQPIYPVPLSGAQ